MPFFFDAAILSRIRLQASQRKNSTLRESAVRAAFSRTGGHKPSGGALYLMLQNRIYRGEITHKGDACFRRA